MDRRSFIFSLVGGLAAASISGMASAEAAKPGPTPERAAGEDLASGAAEALDGAEAEFSQYRRRRYYRPRYRRRYYRRYPRYYRRPRFYRRPRYYYRPRRRYYRRYW